MLNQCVSYVRSMSSVLHSSGLGFFATSLSLKPYFAGPAYILIHIFSYVSVAVLTWLVTKHSTQHLPSS